MVNRNKMPEAEVSLRLAFFLVENKHATDIVRVAIDGAQVRLGATNTFPFPLS